MDILKMLDKVVELAVEKPRWFGPIAIGINRDEINMQIAKVRASLPAELKAAAQTVREKDKVLDNAREDATQTLEGAQREAERLVTEAKKESDRIVQEARIQQERMVTESEVLKLAKAEAEEVRNAAEREATQMRRGADDYCYELLNRVEGILGKAISHVQNGKAELQRPLPGDTQAISQREGRR